MFPIYWSLLATALTSTPIDPADPGPYRVGVLTIDILDASRNDRLLRTEVWYPTDDKNSLPAPHLLAPRLPAPRYQSGIPTEAIRNAPPAQGSFPWLVFSHGLSALREQSTFLTEHLASYGYVVVAPDHQHNTSRDFHPLGIYRSILDRPLDITVVLDEVLALSRDPHSLLHGLVQPKKIGVIGHSLGGYTALAVGGAWVNSSRFPKIPKISSKPKLIDYTDDRVRAVVALVPLMKPALGPEGLSQLSIPAFIVGASEDMVTPFEKNQAPIYENLSGPSFLVSIPGATHFSFNNEEMLEGASPLIRMMHKPKIDRTTSDAIIRRLILAFVDRYVSGTNRFERYLSKFQPGFEIQSRNLDEPIRQEIER